MNILIIGNGGREHALAWKAAQSPLADKVFVAPGNAGTALEHKVDNVNISATDIPALVKFAQDKQIGLTIVGPEAPLVIGVVDAFRAAGLKIFGPTQAAAQLEGSKAFTKDFLARHKIPTAEYQNFTEVEPALAYLREKGAPIVVKADGLAVDGKNVEPMATSQDHKRVGENDTGLNTGGMGAYSPAPVVTPEIHDRIMREVIYPTVNGMAVEGNVYTGFLYAGLMIMPNGQPKVIEFNCRFGDPETQPIMLRLESDLVELCLKACEGKLDEVKSQWNPKASLGIVLAAEGYPGDYRKGDVISGLPQSAVENEKVFLAAN